MERLTKIVHGQNAVLALEEIKILKRQVSAREVEISLLKDENAELKSEKSGCWLCKELLQSEFDFYEQKHSIQMIHGKIRVRFGNKEITSFKANHCPNCGRKLRGGEDEKL